MERDTPTGNRVRDISRRVVDGLGGLSMLPAATDRKTSTHIRDAAPATEAEAVDAVVRAFPGTEVVRPQPDDAA